eukprot:scaffold1534_cov267-Pinguiococcus_pyrenoidosus.AAC.7
MHAAWTSSCEYPSAFFAAFMTATVVVVVGVGGGGCGGGCADDADPCRAFRYEFHLHVPLGTARACLVRPRAHAERGDRDSGGPTTGENA